MLESGSMHIYKITNTVNGKVYVGQTNNKNPLNRWWSHKTELRSNKHKNEHLQFAWNKYGESSFSFEIITKVSSSEELDQAEVKLIAEYNSMNSDFGYNKQSGGHLNKVLCQGSRDKIAAKARGRVHTSEAKDRMRTAKLGKYVGENNFNFGKKASDETKRKQSQAKVGKPTWNAGKKMDTVWCKRIRKSIFCKTNGKTYESIRIAASELELSESKISLVCRGLRNHTGNFVFEFISKGSL